MARSVWTRSFTNIVSPNKLWQSVIIIRGHTFEHLMPKLWQCQLVVVVGCIWTRSPTVGTKISGKNHYLTTSTLPYLLPHFTHSQDSNFYLCINRLHLTTHHEWTIKWGYVLSTTLNFHATCLHQRLKQRKRRTATKKFERTRIRFFIDVFTGVTVVVSQGLYQRNDIRRMFIKSGNEKWKEKKYFTSYVSARFRLCLLYILELH